MRLNVLYAVMRNAAFPYVLPREVLLGLVLLAQGVPASAQTSAQSPATQSATGSASEAPAVTAVPDKPAAHLPAWAVLTLQPVSGDRVRPVTGLVISSDGLVVVPLAFAEEGNQMIVLDGGADIIKNGRAAVLKQKFPQFGLAVISAPMLKRPAATLPQSPLQAGDTVYLAAYPPAEEISRGMAPLWQAAVLNATPGTSAASTRVSVSGLPNVTGPLVDACGNFAAFSSAEGVQSMDTNTSPAYLWQDGLQRLLAGMSLTLAEAPCPVPAATTDSAATDSAAAESATDEAETQQTNAASGSTLDEATEVPAEAAQAGGAADPDSNSASAEGGLTAATPVWLYAVLGVCLLVIVMLAAVIWWLRRIKAGVQSSRVAPSLLQESLSAGVGSSTDQDSLPADCVLEITGRMSNGSPFTQACEVSAAAVNAVIGRGAVDLVIDSQAVHREHARVGGSADLLTISDLGSPRGTWINRVPCLRGEIMFITPEDTIFLGDVSFQVALRPRQSGSSAAKAKS